MVLAVRYVEMDATSHSRGDVKLPCRSTLSARSGRPRSRRTHPRPKKSTRTVMTSAARVMGRRHSAWARRRMAEMRVPAWLMYTSDAADDLLCVDLGGRRIIKKKKKK